jgi:signal transduction histidine kinase
VIGAAVLTTGLLLVLAGLTGARIPGGATFARPGITRSSGPADLIRAFVLSPIHPATWYANAALLLGFFVGIFAFAFVAALASTGLTVLLAGIGVVLIAAAIEASRRVARIERSRAFIGEPNRPVAHHYKPLRGSGFLGLLRAEFGDESRWRDVLYVGVNLPLSVIEFMVVGAVWVLALSLLTMPIWYDAVPGASAASLLGPLTSHDAPIVLLRTLLGAALLPVAASLSQLVMALHRAVVTGLLCTSESRELRRQLETLRQSRSAVLDVEASELHRIERDLHDGAQQRLVMLTMDLGLASERIDTDPAAAKQLILDGQQQAHQALAEIRRLVRGIAPSILLDRGLMAALESISGRGAVPVVLVTNLAPGERLPALVERSAYFVATEALANVAKHSGASRAEVRCRREGSRLVVEVWDDGAGGATIDAGGGLAGLANRVAGVDGTFTVSSPVGGPTLVHAEIPLVATAAEADAEPVSFWGTPNA